mmetsp:Transcript_14890/g.42734  ORF Transcript_14890/g.42734 Transcript_14890/m.42734 type:complete len:256 (-) Transcript_14890:1665-2432(-)
MLLEVLPGSLPGSVGSRRGQRVRSSSSSARQGAQLHLMHASLAHWVGPPRRLDGEAPVPGQQEGRRAQVLQQLLVRGQRRAAARRGREQVRGDLRRQAPAAGRHELGRAPAAEAELAALAEPRRHLGCRRPLGASAVGAPPLALRLRHVPSLVQVDVREGPPTPVRPDGVFGTAQAVLHGADACLHRSGPCCRVSVAIPSCSALRAARPWSVDVSRAVGWFHALLPLLRSALKRTHVHRQLRRPPAHFRLLHEPV